LHNRLIVLVLILAACVVLLTLFPLLAAKAASTVSNREAMEAMVLEEVSGVMSFVSGLGSVLAAWCAADALQSELRSGTVLAVMATGEEKFTCCQPEAVSPVKVALASSAPLLLQR